MGDYSDMMTAPHFSEDLQKAVSEGRADEYDQVEADLYGFLKGDYMGMDKDGIKSLIDDACAAFSANDQKRIFTDLMEQIEKGQVPTIRIYRAVPDFVNEINPGDWVTFSKDYARGHGESRFDGASDIDGWHILEKDVPITQVWWDQGSPYELGWDPHEIEREVPKDIDKDLSKEQREYFKNSVIRDDNGNLLEVYHGTTNQKVFDAFDPARIGRTNGLGHGAGFNFTDNLDMAKHYATHQVSMNTIKPLIDMPYGHVYKCYLNITKPLSTDERTLTREDMENAFFDAVYAIGSGYDYDAITEACKNSVENLMEGRSDSDIITILSEDALDFAMSDSDVWGDFEAKVAEEYIDSHYDEIISNYGEEWDTSDVLGWDFASNQAKDLISSAMQSSIGFDGFKGQMYGGGTAYIALSPDQIKATVNLNPTRIPDMFEGFNERSNTMEQDLTKQIEDYVNSQEIFKNPELKDVPAYIAQVKRLCDSAEKSLESMGYNTESAKILPVVDAYIKSQSKYLNEMVAENKEPYSFGSPEEDISYFVEAYAENMAKIAGVSLAEEYKVLDMTLEDALFWKGSAQLRRIEGTDKVQVYFPNFDDAEHNNGVFGVISIDDLKQGRDETMNLIPDIVLDECWRDYEENPDQYDEVHKALMDGHYDKFRGMTNAEIEKLPTIKADIDIDLEKDIHDIMNDCIKEIKSLTPEEFVEKYLNEDMIANLPADATEIPFTYNNGIDVELVLELQEGGGCRLGCYDSKWAPNGISMGGVPNFFGEQVLNEISLDYTQLIAMEAARAIRDCIPSADIQDFDVQKMYDEFYDNKGKYAEDFDERMEAFRDEIKDYIGDYCETYGVQDKYRAELEVHWGLNTGSYTNFNINGTDYRMEPTDHDNLKLYKYNPDFDTEKIPDAYDESWESRGSSGTSEWVAIAGCDRQTMTDLLKKLITEEEKEQSHEQFLDAYGNAKVRDEDGNKILSSYGEDIAMVQDGQVYRMGERTELSNISTRHLSMFLEKEIGPDVPFVNYKDLPSKEVENKPEKAQTKGPNPFAKAQLFNQDNGINR